MPSVKVDAPIGNCIFRSANTLRVARMFAIVADTNELSVDWRLPILLCRRLALLIIPDDVGSPGEASAENVHFHEGA